MDVWARIIGLSYEEYIAMPIGELGDMISAYILIQNPEAKEGKKEQYIPNLR